MMTDWLQILDEIMVVLEPFVTLMGEHLAKAVENVWRNFAGLVSPIETVKGALGKAGEAMGDMGEKFRANRLVEIARTILTVLKPALQVLLALFSGDFGRAFEIFLGYLQLAIPKIFGFLEKFLPKAAAWGFNFIAMIAKGVLSAVSILAHLFRGTGVQDSPLKPHEPQTDHQITGRASS